MTNKKLLTALAFVAVSLTSFALSYLLLQSTKFATVIFSGIVALTLFFIQPFIGLINYFFFLYVRPHEYVTALSGIPVMLLIGSATLAIMIIHMIVKRHETAFARAPQNWIVLWFLIAITASQLQFMFVRGALAATQDFVAVVLLYFLVANLVNSETKLKIAFNFIVVVTITLAIQGIVQYVTGTGLGGQEMYRGRIQGIGIFEDPNDLAMALVIALPYLFFVMTEYGSPGARLVSAAAIGVLLVALFLTDSRGGMLAFALLSFLLFSRRFGWVAGIAIGAVLMGGMFVASARMAEISTEEGSIYGRIEAWAVALDLFEQYPVLGVGAGNYTEHHFRTAHNSYLLCAAELGIIGLFPWIMLLYLSMKNLSFISKEAVVRDMRSFVLYVDAVRYGIIAYAASAVFLSRTYSELLFILLGLTTAITFMFVKKTGERFKLVEKTDWIATFAITVCGLIFMKVFLIWAW
jgi:O-antigen ligase